MPLFSNASPGMEVSARWFHSGTLPAKATGLLRRLPKGSDAAGAASFGYT